MDDFVITSTQGARCTFHSRGYRIDGWLESFEVTLESEALRAAVTVANPGFASPPSEFFARLAVSESGWQGREIWRAAEGEFEMQATCDRTGHVKFSFSVPESAGSAYWTATAFVFVELGALASIASEARDFFMARPSVAR